LSKITKVRKGLKLVKKISQHVDTLKFHYYIAKTIEDEQFKNYTTVVTKLIALKKEAQTAKNEYQDTKQIKHYFSDSENFSIMPTSISGFSVVIYNNDISIALRKAKSKINPSPSMKVEFRAEFLARKGYKRAIEIVNNFVSKHLLEDYKIKISEIHLATDIQGYNFTPLDFYRMKTRSRKSETHEETTDYSKASSFGGLTTFSGFAFGGGDYHLRVYNKTLEINKFKNKSFAKTLLWSKNSDYNPSATVWRLEIQIRRAKLKKLINSDNSTMDDYTNILNGIPSLWQKAMQDFTIKDINDKDTFNMLRGYRTLKNGTNKPLTKQAIYGIFKRSEALPFWDYLKVWNGHDGTDISTAFNMPQNGAFEYVSNSIKSLYSTLAKYSGSVDNLTLVQAFKEANEQNIEKKGISLIEDSFIKQIDWFERIEFMKLCGVVDVPSYKDLENNIFTTVLDANNHIHNVVYSDYIKDKLHTRKHNQVKQAIAFQTRPILHDNVEAYQVF